MGKYPNALVRSLSIHHFKLRDRQVEVTTPFFSRTCMLFLLIPSMYYGVTITEQFGYNGVN